MGADTGGCGRGGGGNTKRRSHEVPISDSYRGDLSPEASGQASASEDCGVLAETLMSGRGGTAEATLD